MVDKIIDDIERALKNEAYLAALSLVLILPDICGKVMYKDEKNNKRRYIGWYDENIGKYEKCPRINDSEIKIPYLSGEVIYSLRNSMLHQGTPNISESDIKDEENMIKHFSLIIEKENEFNIYADSSSACSSSDINEIMEYSASIRRLCLIICSCAKNYYLENKEKFNFFNYSLINWK